ncbi:oligosaccharide flippase family protein, partial [Enterobacter hormaechei]
MKDRVKNIIYNAVYQVFIIVIPILTMPYVSRKLGAENLGINTYTQSLVLLLGLFINSSILQIGAREIARQDRISRTKTFITLWSLQVLCGLLIIIVYILIIMGSKYYYYYLLQLPFLISYIFDISWFFVGLEKIKNVVFRNMFVKVCTIFLIFLLIKNKNDLSIYIIIISLGSLVGNFIFFFSLKKYLDFDKIVGLDLSNLRPFINSIVILLVPQVAIQLYQYIIKFSIENSTTTTELSYFDQSQKISRIIIQLVSSISIVLMPVIANLDKNKSRNALNKIIKLSVNYSLSIAVIFTILLVIISPTFVPIFFGPEFKEMIPHMIISSFIIIPICVGGVFSNQLILGMGLYKY